MNTSQENSDKNQKHYDAIYNNVNINYIINKLNNLQDFMADAIKTDTSWVGLYHNNFQAHLKGKKILELGCGDCLNAAIMAALGADVYANDISQVSGKIIESLNTKYEFEFPVKFIEGDFLKTNLSPNQFDIVIGKAFIHHLTHEQEIQFTKMIVALLKPNGIVRYVEPAVNCKILDELRWLTPVPGRPSKIQRKKFNKWKLNDPHPERDNSYKRYKMIGNKYFYQTNIVPFGTLERLHRLLPKKNNRKFRRFAFKIEKYIPNALNLLFARTQLIEYRDPKKA